MSATFIHLHLHSEFSLVDGVVRIKPLIQATAAAAAPAVALTDMGNLFAAIKFYRAAQAAGVKPLIGAELWLKRDDSQDPEQRYRFVALCQNLNGYRNLTRLISASFLRGHERDRAVVDAAWLRDHSDGLIVLSGAKDGDVGRALLNGNAELARRWLSEWRALFPDRYFLELVRTGRPGEEDYLHAAVELALATATPVVASNDVRFLDRGDFDAHEARVCINQGRQLADPNRPRTYSEQQYLRTPAEMAELFADLPEALENSVQIALRCNLQLTLGESVLPDFPIPDGMTTDGYFTQVSREGLEQRLDKLFDRGDGAFAERRKPYDERLQIELDVICQMGFPGYFLIVADFISWSRDNGVPVGPGRGSGAGSLVAYALGITDLDPIGYELLFERFLNPERVSMPDFDIDFCMEGRDRVIDYVARRYGRDRVSQIATHGTMAAKAVVRDVGRVLGHPYGFVDRIAKLIPFRPAPPVTLDEALGEEDFRRAYDDDDEVRALVDLAKKLEGLARNVGKHAGGVVIAPSDLTDFSPLYCEPGSDSIVTQYDKDDVEAVGLVKFDFLGLRTLTIIDWALATVNRQRRTAGEPPLDISDISLKDKDSFELLKRCETTAVFQLESRGMKELIKRLQPDRFEDIVALVALFRPGPLQSGMVDDFINRKHGRAEVVYPHPDLEPILEPTYGVILYQEQVMQIAQVLANYSLGGADLLRRAMGKKKPEEMAKQRSIFLDGAGQRRIDPELSGYIFDLMEKFAGYGFNRSHSAAYALVSYQTAWLKTHYPAAFMAAVLSSDMDTTDKVVIFIEECRRMKLKVVPPSVNASSYRFTVNDKRQVVYGLGAIKGVGKGAIEAIVNGRSAASGGEFTDLFDLCRRIDLGRVNKRVMEALICGGACDCFAQHRAALLTQLPEALAAADQNLRAAAAGQGDLFGLPESLPAATAAGSAAVPEWDDGERLREEKKALGLYLTGHPITRYEQELAAFVSSKLVDVVASGGGGGGGGGYRRQAERDVVVAGLVIEVRTRVSKTGNRMAFVTVDDRSARLEVRVFAEVYDRYRDAIVEDQVLVVQGKLGYDDFTDSVRLSAERLLGIDEARNEYAQRLLLKIDASQFGNGILDHLSTTLGAHRDGRCPVSVDYTRPGARARLALDKVWRVTPREPLLRELRQLVGRENVELHYRGDPAP